ncbi:MAG TPA: HAMP domain-containing protein, partial [Chitinophagaceae bacterium]
MKPVFLPRLSIRQRLTVLTCILLLTIIVVFGWLAYVGVKKEALKTGHERLQLLSEQLSAILASSARNGITTTYVAGNRPAVQQYLSSGGKDSLAQIQMVLAELRRDTANLQVELRDIEKKLVLRSAKQGIDISINIDPMFSFADNGNRDSGRVGKFYQLNDIIIYPLVVPVAEQGRLVGYIVRWRRTTTGSRTLEQISKIMGPGAKLYVGNADGTMWTDMLTVVSPPLDQRSHRSVVEYVSQGRNTVVATVYPIANTSWVSGVELSKNNMLEAANQFLYWLIMAGSILLFAGVFAAWLMSRSLSSPLKKLTRAASAIAAGDYSSAVKMDRYDELGQLAIAFNAMSVQVQNSQRELENKAENYKLLFENNPMPMWIISREKLDVLDVNEAATRHYGYSRDEFMQLSSKDLRPAEDVAAYVAYVQRRNRGYSAGVWRHKKKNGT